MALRLFLSARGSRLAHSPRCWRNGGLRVGFTPKNSDPPFPQLHAGDEIAVLAQARPPQIFRDRGAFDRREFLAQQNIDLLATLRTAALLEKLSSSPPTLQTRLAHVRH